MKTFEEIVPLWSEKLKRGYGNAREPCVINGQVLDITKYQVCIAGEAWKFKSSKEENRSCVYSHGGEDWCEACTWFANDFDNVLTDLAYDETLEDKSNLRQDEERFNRLKERFVLHWNENHENI